MTVLLAQSSGGTGDLGVVHTIGHAGGYPTHTAAPVNGTASVAGPESFGGPSDPAGPPIRTTNAELIARFERDAWQPHQVLLAGVWVVYPRVPGVRREIGHRLTQRGGVRAGERLGPDLISTQRPHQLHALGRAERQIKTVHAPLAERAPARTVGCDPVIEPTRYHHGIGRPACALGISQADQPGHGMGVPG
jgi:hypothetical protein